MPRITVALLGSREHAFTEASIFDKADRAKRWDKREQVELDVVEDETLGAILKRAGTELGVQGPDGSIAPVPTFIAFFDDLGPQEFIPTSYVLTLVDEAGQARWNVPYEAVTFGELERAREAGALSGDPRRLYYVTHPGIGNGVLITFAQFAVGLKVIWDVMQAVSTVEDTIGFTDRVVDAARGRLGRTTEVLEKEALRWEMRGATPEAVAGMLGKRPWHPADAAKLLGVSEDEAEAVLWAFGYAQDDTGLWRSGADEPARLLASTLDEIQMSYSLGHTDFTQTLENRAKHHLAQGERAPRPYVDAERFGDEITMRKRQEEFAASPSDDGVDFEDFDDDFDGEPELPLDHLLLKCACGKPECTAIAGFGVANGNLKIGFQAPTDHFVLDPRFLAQIAIQTNTAIEDAKDPPSGSD